MKLAIFRVKLWPEGWQGQLLVDGTSKADTIEPHPTNPIHPGHPCVTAGGPYKVILTRSPELSLLFKRDFVTPEVLNIPGRSSIRIHPANWPKQLLGCTAPGTADKETCAVWNSQAAFARILSMCEAAVGLREAITITYHDPEPELTKENSTP